MRFYAPFDGQANEPTKMVELEGAKWVIFVMGCCTLKLDDIKKKFAI